VHTLNVSNCKKNAFSFPVAVNNSIKVDRLVFLVINICNHGKHYETPRINIIIIIIIFTRRSLR
jgi:hypothetical protein